MATKGLEDLKMSVLQKKAVEAARPKDTHDFLVFIRLTCKNKTNPIVI